MLFLFEGGNEKISTGKLKEKKNTDGPTEL